MTKSEIVSCKSLRTYERVGKLRAPATPAQTRSQYRQAVAVAAEAAAEDRMYVAAAAVKQDEYRAAMAEIRACQTQLPQGRTRASCAFSTCDAFRASTYFGEGNAPDFVTMEIANPSALGSRAYLHLQPFILAHKDSFLFDPQFAALRETVKTALRGLLSSMLEPPSRPEVMANPRTALFTLRYLCESLFAEFRRDGHDELYHALMWHFEDQ